jgi:hypothetical protein
MVFRPPAVPLIVHDPYLSVWSMADRLTEDWPRHWTGKPFGMTGLIRVGDRTFRFCGASPSSVPALEQKSLTVEPSRTLYAFSGPDFQLDVEFWSPTLIEDMDVAARPIGFIDFRLSGSPQQATLYLDLTGEWCTNEPSQRVTWGRYQLGDLHLGRMGAADQNVLGHVGDDRRIDWGYVSLGAASADVRVSGHNTSRNRFGATGRLPDSDDLRMPRATGDDWPVIAVTAPLQNGQRTSFVVAYDDIRSIEYFDRPLQAYWSVREPAFARMLEQSWAAREALHQKVVDQDKRLMTDAKSFGSDYALALAIAFRQAMGAHKIVADIDGTPLMFSKENFSNGCIGTVDVTYPGSPLFLLYNPTMLEAQIRPILDYASMPRWKWDFAPHDLGTYPKANGQVYGGGELSEENQMPVEECGNMLILTAALASRTESTRLPERYWPVLTRWANYLSEHAQDPANQLCTDDFAGHLARNANLSLKGIIGVGAYAQMAKALGRTEAGDWRKRAETMAAQWMDMARGDGRTVLAFGQSGTWSQKYNLIWDRLLGLGLFPEALAKTELAAYRKVIGKYGLPLDSRVTYTKTDWVFWTASLTGDTEDFKAIAEPTLKWITEGPDRIPLSDWYETGSGRVVGFRARSVVGGLWMPILADRMPK